MSKQVRTKVRKRASSNGNGNGNGNGNKIDAILTKEPHPNTTSITPDQQQNITVKESMFQDEKMKELLEPKKLGRATFKCWLDIVFTENLPIFMLLTVLVLFALIFWGLLPDGQEGVVRAEVSWWMLGFLAMGTIFVIIPIGLFTSRNTSQEFAIKAQYKKGLKGIFKHQMVVYEKLKEPNSVGGFKCVVDLFEKDTTTWTQRLKEGSFLILAVSVFAGVKVVQNDIFTYLLTIISSYFILLSFFVSRVTQYHLRKLRLELLELEEINRTKQ